MIATLLCIVIGLFHIILIIDLSWLSNNLHRLVLGSQFSCTISCPRFLTRNHIPMYDPPYQNLCCSKDSKTYWVRSLQSFKHQHPFDHTLSTLQHHLRRPHSFSVPHTYQFIQISVMQCSGADTTRSSDATVSPLPSSSTANARPTPLYHT